jgi:hypothetical protein
MKSQLPFDVSAKSFQDFEITTSPDNGLTIKVLSEEKISRFHLRRYLQGFYWFNVTNILQANFQTPSSSDRKFTGFQTRLGLRFVTGLSNSNGYI